MSVFTVVQRSEVIFTEYIPNMYEGLLAQKVVDITDDLKVIIDITQETIDVFDINLQPQVACLYKIHVREVKNGIIRPYLGDGINNILKDRYKSTISNIHYAILALSNVWDYDEPSVYEVILRVEFKEPIDATFPSFINTVC